MPWASSAPISSARLADGACAADVHELRRGGAPSLSSPSHDPFPPRGSCVRRGRRSTYESGVVSVCRADQTFVEDAFIQCNLWRFVCVVWTDTYSCSPLYVRACGTRKTMNGHQVRVKTRPRSTGSPTAWIIGNAGCEPQKPTQCDARYNLPFSLSFSLFARARARVPSDAFSRPISFPARAILVSRAHHLRRRALTEFWLRDG